MRVTGLMSSRRILIAVGATVTAVYLLLYVAVGKFQTRKLGEEENILHYMRSADTASCSSVKDLNDLLPNESMACVNPEFELQSGSCLIYWLGNTVNPLSISGLERSGCQIYVFTPWSQDWNASRWPNVHLHEIGIGYRDTDDDPVDGWKRRTLSSLYQMFKKEHGDCVVDLVMMDVQHAEWSIIPQIVQSGILGRVKQLSINLHFDEIPFIEYLSICMERLKLLEHQGEMIRFLSQCNSTAIQLGGFKQLNSRMFWFNSKFKP